MRCCGKASAKVRNSESHFKASIALHSPRHLKIENFNPPAPTKITNPQLIIPLQIRNNQPIMARETRNNRPVMTPPPRTPSILHKLPAEVRLRIYPHALAVGWNDSAPNLLVALAKERDLFAEAREIYLKVNGTIHDGNARSYNTMRLNGALKLRNLMLSCRAGPYVVSPQRTKGGTYDQCHTSSENFKSFYPFRTLLGRLVAFKSIPN